MSLTVMLHGNHVQGTQIRQLYHQITGLPAATSKAYQKYQTIRSEFQCTRSNPEGAAYM